MAPYFNFDMQDESDRLMQGLVTLAVAPSSLTQQDQVREQMKRATSQSWERCINRLDEHRLMALVQFGLHRADCLNLVPEREQRQLSSQFEYSRAMNLLRWMSLQALASRLRESGVAAVACKGVVLSQRYYPHPATRYMNDIDLWIDEKARAQSVSVLTKMGFEIMPEKALRDGGCYQNAMGMVVDLHHRMRIFEGLDSGGHELTEPFEPHAFLVHEPHALIAHLRAHLESHHRETGPMLCWLLDLGFVVGGSRERLDPDRLQRLITQVANWEGLLSALRMLKESFNMAIPEDLLHRARHVEPLSLASVLSQRRLALWGLPHPRGWARLLLQSLRRAKEGDRPWPRAHDLITWPFDQPTLSRRRRE